jgi:sarcosine oxidase
MNFMPNSYDVIVLGLGVMGAGAAYHLARAGHRVLAIEQFALDHQMGSSYGESRIIRYMYDHPLYVKLADHAFRQWRELESESGNVLMVSTGGLDFGPADSAPLRLTRQVAIATGTPHEWLTPAETMQRFPQFHLRDDMMAIFQADSAVLRASDCVIALAECARQHGATLLTETPIHDIQVTPSGVTVAAQGATYTADRIVIAAGPWAKRVLSMLDLDLPLQPWRQQQVFIRPPHPEDYAPERFPIFICHEAPIFYGLPDMGGTGLKMAVHKLADPVDPDTCNRAVDESEIRRVQDFARATFPSAGDAVGGTRVCLYTMTPDEHFIVDRHPAFPHVVFAAGFSGHGFKFGPLIGRILADLATAGTTRYPIDLFSVRRFLAG